MCPALGKKDVARDHGLLLEPIAIERLSGFEDVIVSAERMAHERQVEAAFRLGLPDVSHFMDEEPLTAERLGRKILRPDLARGVEIDIAHWRHRRLAWMERPPFAL